MGAVLDEVMKDKYEMYEKRGIEKGIEKGVDETRITTVRNLMKSLKFTAEQAMEAIGIPKSEYNKYLTML